MLLYPSIPGSKDAPVDRPCWAFYKYDGQNIRFHWNSRKGWHRFGTRTSMFDASSSEFGQIIEVFQDTIADRILSLVQESSWKSPIRELTAFCEWYGENSIAGIHQAGDSLSLRVIDLAINGVFIDPKTFHGIFSSMEEAAELVYCGPLTSDFISGIQDGTFSQSLIDRPINEGVVCKGMIKNSIWRCKIKTNAYRETLKRLYDGEWEKFWE